MHDVGTAELHAELERPKFRRCADRIGDVLVNRNPVGEASARHAVVANLIARLEVLPGEPGHAALMRIARAILGGDQLQAIDDEHIRFIGLERCEDGGQ